MKNKIILFTIALAFISIVTNAQPGFLWAKRTGTTTIEHSTSIRVDASGNVYTIGSFIGTVDFDPGASVYNLTSAGAYDIFVCKLDASGNFVWAKSMGGTNSDQGLSIALDASGNVYTTGYFQNTADFDPGTSVSNYTATGGYDVFINKLDASGNFVWTKQIGGTNNEVSYSIAVDASGNIFTTGYFKNSVDFDPGLSVYTLTTSGGSDVFISKLDAFGDFVWAKCVGGISGAGPNSIAVDGAGNVLTAGYFFGTGDFDPGASVYNLTATGSNYDMYINKLDASGNFVWAKSMGSTGLDEVFSLALDASGNVYTSGYFQNTVDFDPGSSVYNLTSIGSGDVFINKLDASGNFVWAKSFGGSSNDNADGIAIDASGNVYTTGYFQNTVDFDPGISVNNITATGSADIFINILDANGNYLQTSRMGGSSSDEAFAIAVDASGNIYTTGEFNGTADFDPSTNLYNLTSAGNSDVFVSKLSNSACATITTSVLSQNVTCNGNTNGSATITASGGIGFTYSWAPSGGTNASASGLSAQIYSCVVTNSCGSTTTQTINIVNPPVLTLTASANNTIVCVGKPSTLTANGIGGTGNITYSWVNGVANNIYVVNPTIATVYTVSITDANNCTTTQTVSVSTNSLPIISVNNGAICKGSSFTITPSGASTYTFSSGSAIVSPTTNTSYSVSGTSSVGCVSAFSAVSNITVNALPVISVNNATICMGSTSTLVASGANTYTWNTGTFGPNLVASPTISTNYTLTGTSLAGCTNTANANIAVGSAPSIAVNSASICVGFSATLTASGVNTYTWSNGANTPSISIAPLSTTIYTVSGNLIGCNVTANNTVTVIVISNPTVITSNTAVCSGTTVNLLASGATTYSWNTGATTASISVSPNITSIYTVTGLSSGCSNTKTVSVIVNALPTISVNNGSICLGSSFTIAPSGASTYTFSSGSAIVSPTTNTSYSVSGTSSAGCISTSFAISNISVSALPLINITSSNSLICIGQPATLTASGANTYTWNFGGSGTSIVVSPSITSTYSIAGTNTNGCINTSAITQTVSACTNIQINNYAFEIKLYPNPTNGEFIIDVAEEMELNIYNNIGELVYQTQIQEGKNRIHLFNQTKGIHFITLKTKTQSKTSKLIIN